MGRVAVLTSGGLDSSVLVADLARENEVFPLYIQYGLQWEEVEKATLAAYLAKLSHPNLRPLTMLEMPVRSLYGQHWSTTGEGVPDTEADNAADYLPGRNVFMLAVSSVWCALHDVHQIGIGSLLHNPFPDATPEFFADYTRLLTTALTHEIELLAPYRGLDKWQVIAAHADLPLHLTVTCENPAGLPAGDLGPLQCGACIKCKERHDAFVQAGVPDPTRYAVAMA